jgi:hypothetical protein
LTTVLDAKPPDYTKNRPPAFAVALNANPALNTSTSPLLVTVVLLASPPEMNWKPPATVAPLARPPARRRR